MMPKHLMLLFAIPTLTGCSTGFVGEWVIHQAIINGETQDYPDVRETDEYTVTTSATLSIRTDRTITFTTTYAYEHVSSADVTNVLEYPGTWEQHGGSYQIVLPTVYGGGDVYEMTCELMTAWELHCDDVAQMQTIWVPVE